MVIEAAMGVSIKKKIPRVCSSFWHPILAVLPPRPWVRGCQGCDPVSIAINLKTLLISQMKRIQNMRTLVYWYNFFQLIIIDVVVCVCVCVPMWEKKSTQ